MHSRHYIGTLAHTGHFLHGVSALSDGSLILEKELAFMVPAAHSCWRRRVAVENPVLEGEKELSLLYLHNTKSNIIVCPVGIMEGVETN